MVNDPKPQTLVTGRMDAESGALASVLNKPYLDRQFRQKSDHLALLIEDFEDLAETLLHRLAQALEANDYSAYRDVIHELFGTARSLGASAIEAICERASALPPNQLSTIKQPLLDELHHAITATRSALTHYQQDLVPSHTSDDLETDPGSSPLATTPVKLLLVEDNLLMRRQIREIVNREYQLIETATGAEALAYCEQTEMPDLVLLDLKLTLRDNIAADTVQTVSGLEVARRLPSNVPIIVLTADRSRDTLRTAFAAGAWSYCIKPPDADNLVAAIEMALAHAEARRRREHNHEQDLIISYAEGLLAAEHHLDRSKARQLLRRLASAERRKLAITATTLVDTYTDYWAYKHRCMTLLNK
ncbi:MAG: response regulator [Candidatus Competibacteraceae bacterium]|jgi:response regulator NasT|nr:response regulator [Candidatus Competibacteraceae bacterium]